MRGVRGWCWRPPLLLPTMRVLPLGGTYHDGRKGGGATRTGLYLMALALTLATVSLVDPKHITESSLLQTSLCSVMYCGGVRSLPLPRLNPSSPQLHKWSSPL